jgi:hypothetical protein
VPVRPSSIVVGFAGRRRRNSSSALLPAGQRAGAERAAMSSSRRRSIRSRVYELSITARSDPVRPALAGAAEQLEDERQHRDLRERTPDARGARNTRALQMLCSSARILASRACDHRDVVRLLTGEQQFLHARGHPLELTRRVRRRLHDGWADDPDAQLLDFPSSSNSIVPPWARRRHLDFLLRAERLQQRPRVCAPNRGRRHAAARHRRWRRAERAVHGSHRQ